MSVTELTFPFLYLGICNRFIHAIVLRLFMFQIYGIRCGSWAGTASAACHDDCSAGFIRVADQDTIVEGHKEGVGMSGKKRARSTMCV
jgi:hypothetical protein